MEQRPVIEFKDFSFQYFSQAEPTLRHIDLTIREGEKVLIVGPSGSGKSTIGSCINGLIPFAYKGEITGSLSICGEDTKAMSIFDRSRHVGTVLQDSDGQFVGLTAGEDIAFALENDCMEQSRMKEAVKRIAEMVDMGELLSASPYELSGGQKQRVAFAGVMVDDVDILLLDEPLANLDPATGKTAIDLIDRLHRELKKTVIIIEHRLEDVLYRHVDRIIVISDGAIAADMSPDELMASSILREHGIREPLYVTALKYAGIRVTKDIHPGYIESLDIEAVRDGLRAWDERKEAPLTSEEVPEILSLNHVSFRYNDKRRVIEDVSFSVKRGEMLSIVGTNGAGKSTIAKLICGFVKEDEGDLLFEGSSMKDLTIRERADLIGYVMQNPNQMLCKPMIYDEVALGLRLRGVPEEEIKERVYKALRICGLYEFREWPVAALSFGQKKRVTIASILVLEPKVLILDEPTAGQDYKHYTDIMEFLRSLNKLGITIIMITHDMHLMLEYTTHAVVIAGGRKIGDSTAVDILTNEEIAKAANLKLTSLYELAKRCGLSDPQSFVSHFIDHERREERHEG